MVGPPTLAPGRAYSRIHPCKLVAGAAVGHLIRVSQPPFLSAASAPRPSPEPGGDSPWCAGTASVRVPGHHGLYAQLVCVPVRLALLMFVGENLLEHRHTLLLRRPVPKDAVIAQGECVSA